MIIEYSETLRRTATTKFGSPENFATDLTDLIDMAFGDFIGAWPDDVLKHYKRACDFRDLYDLHVRGFFPDFDRLLLTNFQSSVRMWASIDYAIELCARKHGSTEFVCSFRQWSQNHKELIRHFADNQVILN